MPERTPSRRRPTPSSSSYAGGGGMHVGRRSPSPNSGSGSNRRARPSVPVQKLRRQPRRRVAGKVLVRSASEPLLFAVPRGPHQPLSPPSPPPPPLSRPHTCFDVLSPSSPFAQSASSVSPPTNPGEEAKVVVSVTVEGSAGPVKAMVRLGDSVGEAISAVVERYRREGRSPRLDPVAAESFQLHHSHFCLQSLNRSDKIGEVGGRSFYLHKSDGSNNNHLQREECDFNTSGSTIAFDNGRHLAPHPTHHHFFFSFVTKKLDKISRRTKRLWRVVTCITCG